VLYLDDLRHSYVDLADPTYLDFRYTQRFADVIDAAFPAGEPLDAVHLGGGGFTMPRWLAATRPGSRSTVLELDPAVVRLGRERLALEGVPGVDVAVGDARTSLQALPDDSADVVIGDAFGSLSVPWHLATRELMAGVRRVLRPDGVYVINVIDYGPLDFLRAEAATVSSLFAEVGILARPDQLAGGGGNAIIVASDRALPWSSIEQAAAARGEPGLVLRGAAYDEFVGDAQVLTDDFAPVEQLLTPYVVR
jgi:spermidine synthase